MKEKDNMEPIYTITGTVVHGRGIGKHVGTPTANIEVDEHATLRRTRDFTRNRCICGKNPIG